jgi:hypothetical protein
MQLEKESRVHCAVLCVLRCGLILTAATCITTKSSSASHLDVVGSCVLSAALVTWLQQLVLHLQC